VIASALQTFSVDAQDLAELTTELRQLAVKIQRIIPGYADAALIVVRDGLALAVRASRDSVTGPYRSSLLVGSLHEPASAQLLVRATSADAFVGLAHDFLALSAATTVRTPLVDLHLDGGSAQTGVALVTVELADMSAVNQAVGALLDRGCLPQEATDELDRIGVELAVPSPVAARLFLRGLVNRDAAQPPVARKDP
jgi:hypothetical protein